MITPLTAPLPRTPTRKGICNIFGKKADTDVLLTYSWIRSHLEEDITVSIPKHEVYEEYRAYCEANRFDKLCVADFGKAMKHIFPQVKPRRLGQRGNSKYCYSGLRKKTLVETPELPALDTSEYRIGGEEPVGQDRKSGQDAVWKVVLDWAEKLFNRKFKFSTDLARYLIETQNVKPELAHAFRANDSKASGSGSKTQTANKKKDVCSQISKKMSEKKKCDISNSLATKAQDSGQPSQMVIKSEPEETALSGSSMIQLYQKVRATGSWTFHLEPLHVSPFLGAHFVQFVCRRSRRHPPAV